MGFAWSVVPRLLNAEQIRLFIVHEDRSGRHPCLNPFRGLRMERRPNSPIAFFVEKHVMNACFVKQMTDFDIAYGGPAAPV